MKMKMKMKIKKVAYYLAIIISVFLQWPLTAMTFDDDIDRSKPLAEYHPSKGEGDSQGKRFNNLELYLQNFTAKYLELEKSVTDLKNETLLKLKEDLVEKEKSITSLKLEIDNLKLEIKNLRDIVESMAKADNKNSSQSSGSGNE